MTNPIALAASKTGEHARAINTSGNLRCWGKGTSGQLGDAATVNSHTAVEVKLDDGTTKDSLEMATPRIKTFLFE